MLTLKQIYFKNWCFLLFFLGLGVFSSNILQAQNCNPDIEAPILLGKSPYTLNLDNGVRIPKVTGSGYWNFSAW